MTYPLNEAWRYQLHDVFHKGQEVSPRGMLTRELPSKQLIFDMNHPVITIPERQLGYKFMAAEAWWLLSGHDDVASISPYSKAISQFSDDGERFFGSYGPPFVLQLTYVVDTLLNDPDTRQATMTFWRQNPPKTKDVPCTIAIDFLLRNGLIDTHVFMRSSDNWLGIPYDAFNFTMMTCRVLEMLNAHREPGQKYQLGTMYLTAASSHLYEKDFENVKRVLATGTQPPTRPVPLYLYGIYEHPPEQYHGLIRFLEILKDTTKDDSKYRWWV